MPRPRPTRPTKRHKADALATLAGIVRDPDAPAHAKASAARAILNLDRPASAAANDPKGQKAPGAILVLPHNERDNRTLGIHRDDDGVARMVLHAGTPEGERDRDKWLAQIDAERAAEA